MNPLLYRQSMRRRFYAAVIITLILLFVGWWTGSLHDLTTSSARLIAIGRLFGLLGAWCIILEIILMSRLPFIEHNFDLQDTVDLHRLSGYGVLIGIAGHVVFLVIGYATPLHTGWWTEFLNFNTQYDDILWATIGTILLTVTMALSVHLVRSKMRYEIWYLSHLTIYFAILLTFLHQIKTGGDFIGHFAFTAYWYALYILAFTVWAWYRVLRPFYLMAWYQLKIELVQRVTHDTYSIIVGGRHVERLSFVPGQYATWRILAPGLWMEAHPFSLSSPPGRDKLRFTVKASGDFTAKLANVRPGVFVAMDGPRGNFVADRAEDASAITLIAGGIGITPYVPIISSLLQQGKSVTLLYAARSSNDIAFTSELSKLQASGLTVQFFLNDQKEQITSQVLQNFVHNETLVYICGPDGMSRGLSQTLRKQGIDRDRIIVERFAF